MPSAVIGWVAPLQEEEEEWIELSCWQGSAMATGGSCDGGSSSCRPAAHPLVRLAGLRALNFKCFEHAELELTPAAGSCAGPQTFTAIVGPNGALA